MSKFKKILVFSHFLTNSTPTFCKNYAKHAKFSENLGFVKLYTRIMIIVQFVLLWRSSKETFFGNFSQFSTPIYPLKMTLKKKSDAMQSCGNFPVNFKKPKWVCSSYFRKSLKSPILRAEKSNILSENTFYECLLFP